MATATEVRERPILMGPSLVRTSLDGRKTQTRRPVKPQPESYQGESGVQFEYPGWHGSLGAVRFARELCPHGQVGDRLWVRETWALAKPYHDPETGHVDDFGDWDGPLPNSCPAGWSRMYRADWDVSYDHPDDRHFRWRPSIHMPRWACRLVLEITEVRVERLRDISEGDARDEGMPWMADESGLLGYLGSEDTAPPGYSWRSKFRPTWDRFYGDGPYAWEANPWVWAITFRRLTP